MLSTCRAICCSQCQTFYRYRTCASLGECDLDTTEYYACTTARCDGESIAGRTLWVAALNRCMSPVDDLVYRANPGEGEGQLPSGYNVLDPGWVIQCVDDCTAPPCPAQQYAVPAEWCSAPYTALGEPFFACLSLVPQCGVYVPHDGYCAKFEPAAARPVSEILAEFPDAHIRKTAAMPLYGPECCGCGDCIGGTTTILDVCTGVPTGDTTVCCCPEPAPCYGAPGTYPLTGTRTIAYRLIDRQTNSNGDVLIFEAWFYGTSAVGLESCELTQTGTLRERLTQINADGTTTTPIDNTTTSLQVDAVNCGSLGGVAIHINGRQIFGGGFSLVAACQYLADGAILEERFGCTAYGYTFRYDRTINGNRREIYATVSAGQQYNGLPSTNCHRRCIEADLPTDPVPPTGEEPDPPEGALSSPLLPLPKPAKARTGGCKGCGGRKADDPTARSVMEGL